MANVLNLLPLPEFDPHSELGSSVSKRWEIWVKEFSMFVVANGVTDTRKRALLLYMAGSRVREIFGTLTETGEDADFETAKAKLTDYFKPQENTRYEIYKFRQLRQEEGELLDKFHTRLRTASATCNFADVDLEVEQQIIVGGKSSAIRKKALRDPTYKLSHMLVDGRGKEASLYQSRNIEESFKEEIVEKISTHKSKTEAKRKCFNCGGPFPHDKGCPAKGTQCETCLRYNHFASCCRQTYLRKGAATSQRRNRTFNEVKEQGHPNKRENVESSMSHLKVNLQDTSSDSDEYMFLLKCGNSDHKLNPTTKININGKHVKMTIDTGASINVMDEQTFNHFKDVKLEKSRINAYTYGSQQPVKFHGKFKATMETKRAITVADIYVVKERNSGCLLSFKSAHELGVLTLNIDNLADGNVSTESDTHIDNKLEKILKTYDDVFKDDIGKLKGSTVTLNIDETITPVSLKQRRVPFHIRAKVDEEIDRLLQADVIEKIPDNQPTPWVSPIVAVPQKRDSIRLCVDMRKSNAAIKRTRFPIPTINDIDVLLNKSCYFSKLDVRQAFHQIELDEKSRYITTFNTHRGLFRYKRLNFGTNVASEIFQNLLQKHLSDIPGVKNIHDDIIIFGTTRDDHDDALESCLKRLKEIGLTLRKSKCKFLQEELAFYGNIYSKSGIRPDPMRINDILSLAPPSTVREVRSFLGMLNYCSKFIEDFSTLTAPLRDLTTKKTKFIWNDVHQEAFNNLKQKLTSTPVMAYFDITKETQLYVDASPFGLSAILLQTDEHSKSSRVVAYGSRSLTQVEQRYSQTEREALAIIWGVEHFHQYVYGSLITIITDHKPLEVIYGSTNSKPSARIERWVLRLQPYQFRILYKNGKENPADYMSRHPSKENQGQQESYTEHYVHFIAKNAVPKAMTRNEIARETKNDELTNLLKKAISTNNWEDKRLKRYQNMKKEFSVTSDGIILRGTCIYLPCNLRRKAIVIAHESHQGLDKTKALLKEKVWFPKMDDLLTKLIGACRPCLLTSRYSPPEPIKMTSMPEGPWQKIHLDFKGPLPGGKYLLVAVDRYSRYPEVEIIQSTNSATVIRKLNKIFAAHGIPEIVITDNGPPFHSHDFKDYMTEKGSSHQLSTPYWPQGNAEAERFMRTLSKILVITNLQNEDLQEALSKFLFQYRNTPHSTTKIPPAELLFNRRIRGKIPAEKHKVSWEDRHQRARENEKRRNIYNKSYSDKNRKAAYNDLNIGDSVLLKQRRTNKMMTRYSPEPCTIVEINGPEVTLKTNDGRYLSRNKSFCKKIPIDEIEDEDEEDTHHPRESGETAILENESSRNQIQEPRRSSRTTTLPERYGTPIPSSLIT